MREVAMGTMRRAELHESLTWSLPWRWLEVGSGLDCMSGSGLGSGYGEVVRVGPAKGDQGSSK